MNAKQISELTIEQLHDQASEMANNLQDEDLEWFMREAGIEEEEISETLEDREYVYDILCDALEANQADGENGFEYINNAFEYRFDKGEEN